MQGAVAWRGAALVAARACSSGWLRGGILAAALCVLGTATAEAHFIWADVQQGTDGKAEVRFYFGELPKPGEPELIGKIETTRAWLRGADNRATDLRLGRSSDERLAALVAGANSSKSACVEAVCDYGVFQRGTAALLLQYYAKHLPDDWAQAERLARSEKLRLDIVPQLAGDQLTLRVLYDGQPDAGREVIVLEPSGKQLELKTNDEGRVSTTVVPGGNYAVRAAHVEADRGGKRNGKAYSQTWHYCTLTMMIPSGAPPAPAAELSAAELLARARAARSVWRHFPGYTADVTLYKNGQQAAGRLTIDAQGAVTLDVADNKQLRAWGEEQLNSLVQHRMPDDSIPQGKIAYADNEVGHPLGRKIDLGDPQLGSIYRVKDDVITEVNRKMGDVRFTISVLEIARDADNNYLPRSFTMNLFDVASGDLKSNHTYWNDWRRVGDFDLPTNLTEIVTENGAVETRQILFSNWQILENKK